MRPIKLTIQAFGPYTDKNVIDFSKFEDNDIFLICGNTGAGKTAIFDAMSFALYGKASNKSRSNDMLRNSSADHTTKTFVELEFEYFEQVYTISRNPRYLRNKERGEGQTEEVASAELKLPSGEIISGLKQVDEKILEILKINQDQFSQIVMIAQNDFQKFLVSNTSERKTILRTIFATDYYERFENELKLLTNIKRDEYLKEKTTYSYLVSNFKGMDDLFSDDETLNHDDLEQLILESQTKRQMTLQDMSSFKEDLNKKLEAITKSLTLSQKNNEILEKFELYKNKKEALLKQASEIEKKKETIERLDIILKDIKSVDEAYEKQKTSSKEIHETLKVKKTQIDELTQTLLELKKGYDLITKQELNIKALRERYLDIKRLTPVYKEQATTKERLNTNTEASIKLLKTIEAAFLYELEELAQKETHLQEAVHQFQKEQTNLKQVQESFEHLEGQFLSNQAGVFASRLSDNEPCPVCGSIHHPKKATLVMENMEEAYLEAKETYQKASLDINRLREDLEKRRLDLNERQQDLKQLSLIAFNKELSVSDLQTSKAKLAKHELMDTINTYLQVKESIKEDEMLLKTMTIDPQYPSLESLLKMLQDLEAKIEEEEKTVKKVIDTYTQKRELSVKLESEYETLLKQADAEKEKLASLEKELHQLVSRNFDTFEAYQVLKGHIKDYQVLKETVDNYTKELNVTDGLYKDYQKQSANLKMSDLIALQAQQQEVMDALKEVSEAFNKLSAENEHNEEILAKLKIAYGSIQEREKEYLDYQILSDTASGSLSKKAKVQFETYAQMAYFDKVLHYANQRLKLMSNSQYELIRREDPSNLRSQGGLDLDIIDHHYGSVRDVATLSGGESFNTSLALALGLSDAIQYGSGGIKIDALFIDEGFGSLSDDYLDNAIQILIDVAGGNRLIGVISHVKELRDAIPNQIRVSKDQSGSHIDLIIN